MTRSTRTLTALLATCAALAVNGLVLGPMWLTLPGEFSDTAGTTAFALSQRLTWALLTVLVVLVPALLATGPRRRPPAWLAPLAQLALASQAATAFVMGFVAPWLAGVAPHTLDVPGGGLQLAMTMVWIGFVLAMVVLAVGLWRAGHSRVGAVLVLLGGLAIPGAGPVGAAVLAIGLGVATVAQLRAAQREVLDPSLQDSVA